MVRAMKKKQSSQVTIDLDADTRDRVVARRQAQEHLMAPLNIKTRDVPPELAAKWYGMPPTAASTYATKRNDVTSF